MSVIINTLNFRFWNKDFLYYPYFIFAHNF